MHDPVRAIRSKLLRLKRSEEGQDIVEYSFVIAMIALAAVAGMQSLASGVALVFNTVSSTLGSAF